VPRPIDVVAASARGPRRRLPGYLIEWTGAVS
jgi:hypothetical protein